MNEVTLPPSPNWYLSNILSCAKDGTVAWGARNSIVIAHPNSDSNIVKYSLIGNAHADRVTALAFSPEFGQIDKNLIVSGGDEHIVRIWNLDTMSATSSQAYMDTKQKVIGVDWSKCNPDLICFVSSEGLLMIWTVSYNACRQISFGKLTATCLACSLHDSNIVAVGAKSGLIYIVNLQGNGTINYKLRGHDVEITSLSWCPTDVNILNDSGAKDMLLASGAKDRSVFVWRAGGDGRYQLEISLPQKPLDSNQHRVKLGSSGGSWTAVCWAEPKLLLASSMWGELISWDFTMGAKSKPVCKLVHAKHARGLFCIANVPNGRPTEECNWRESQPLIVWTLAQDRQVIRSSVTAIESKVEYSVPTQGGYVYCMAACPLDTSRIAFGVGDAMLRIWNLSEPHETSFDVTVLWQKIMGKVRSIAWHPEKENLLAFGTAEGRVGVWDTNTTKPPILYRQYHRHTVYSLGWGPNPNDKNFALYSCGDSELVYYVPDKPTKETKSVIKKDCTEFAWKPDNSCIVLGFEDGSISFLNRDLKEIGQPIYSLKKSVQCLAWHPDSTATDLNLSPLRNYLAAATSSTAITIFDLTDLVDEIDNTKETSDVQTSADSTVTQHKVVATLCGHVEKVVALAWSSHFSGHLVSGSYDYTAQVWKVETQELIATYTGHSAPVQSCMWSPLDPDYIITGSSDFTIRVWKVSDQKVVMPTEKPQVKRVRTKKNNKNKKVSKALTSETHEEKAASANSKECSIMENSSISAIEEVSKEVVVQKPKKDRPKKCSYLSAYSKRMNDKSNSLKSLRDLVKNVNSQSKSIQNGTSAEINGMCEKSASIFGTSEDVATVLDQENFSHLSQGQYNVATEMSLWNNSLRKNLQEATKEKRLNDFLVSLSASLSMKTWQETCEAYATQLIFELNPSKAVSYLLCIHKIHRAIDIFIDQKMYREAYVLARCKLDAEDEIILKILREWANSASREGNFEDAAQCYAKLGDFAKAAKFIGRRKDIESLEVAAEMGLLSDEPGLAESLADEALVAALINADYTTARRLIDKFPSTQYREVQIDVYEEIKRVIEESTETSGMLKWLEKGTGYGLLQTMRNSCEKFSQCYVRLSQKFNTAVADDEAMLWVNVSYHVAMAAIAPTLEKQMIHVVNAVGAISQFEIVYPKISSAQTESLLIRFLKALDANSPSNKDSLFAKNDLPAYMSLRAFLCYALLDWLANDRVKEIERSDNVIELIQNLLADALDNQTAKYWTATNEINKLEITLASTLGNSQKVEDEGEIIDDTTALLEKLDDIRGEKKRFVEERICAPSPILVYIKATELLTLLPDGSVKDNFSKVLTETWTKRNDAGMEFAVGDVAQMSAELARVVEVMMSPDIPHQQRLDVYNACERFKETSPLCAQCGLYLAQKLPDRSSVVRHFGLQLMEHCIKYRWTQISQTEKIFIKENAMKLLQEGTDPRSQAETHIKDALSRVVVEMIKREWPQQWPTLLAELSQACTRGESQTEVVLLVFLRLVEDVALLQTLESNQRRKDIYQALTTNMAEIFAFFLRLMEQHFSEFQKQSSVGNTTEAAAHSKVVQVVLLTLTGFVEWVSINHIMADEGRLLQILCLLLGDPTFQCAAAECLLQVVNRKGKADRKQLMILFTEEALRCIYSSAVAPGPHAGPHELHENHYLFLKKLTQVLTGMATQLCTLWGKDDSTSIRPNHFNLYLDAVLSFTMHSSLTLTHLANAIWIMLFKHEQIKTDSLLLTYVPKYIESTAPKLIKVAYPNGRNSNGTTAYCLTDYDSEEEFAVFLHRLRMDLLEGFRHATMVAPLVTFAYVQQWLTAKITKGMANIRYKSDPNDLEYLEWEALANALDSVISRILMVNERPSVQNGLQLLELCLSYSPQDPWLLSTLLSCISALFVFLSMSTGSMTMPGVAILPRVLEKIFAALVFETPGETKDSRSKATKNVRRHAASLMVKIGLKYPLLLLPVFEQIHTTVRGLIREPSQLSRMESVILYEALLLISNHFCDYERQTRFVAEVIGVGSSQFIALGLEAFKGPIELIRFVGLDRPPVDASQEDPAATNRSDLMFCISTVLSVVKRCSIPDDPDRAARGGFVAALSESGNPVYRNPATPHVIPVLPTLFALVRAMNALFTPAALASVSEGYRNAHGLLEWEKANLLGLRTGNGGDNAPETDQSPNPPLARMQAFLSNIHDHCYHMLGSVCHTIGRDFYQLPGLAPALLNSVFSNMEVIPDYRLRPIIRVFLKPFIYSCPPAFYESVLVPILTHVSTHMCQRLSAKWQYITRLYESGLDEENTDAQEVIDDMLNRNLTRDFVDVLKVTLVGGAASDASPPDSMDHDSSGMAVDPTTSRGNSIVAEVVSELGAFVLRHPSTCHSVVLCVLGALSWNDSNASLKATMLTGPIVRALASDGSLTPAMAAHIMVAVLQGLQLHGQHEANQGCLVTLGAQVYECLRPKFPNIIEVMQQIPGVNPADLQRFDEKIAVTSTKGNKVEKGKKDLFKKITNQLIGRSVGQLFRKEVKIDNLPRLDVTGKTRIVRVDDISKNSADVGLTALFAGPT